MRRVVFIVCLVAVAGSAPVEAQDRRDDARMCCDAGGEEPLWRDIKELLEAAGDDLIAEARVKLCEIGVGVGCNGGLM